MSAGLSQLAANWRDREIDVFNVAVVRRMQYIGHIRNSFFAGQARQRRPAFSLPGTGQFGCQRDDHGGFDKSRLSR
jgi:hypothetical protein